MASNPYQRQQSDLDPPRRPESLTGRDLFGVVVRSVGLLAVLYALWTMTGMLAPAEGYTPADYLASSVPLLLVGLIFLLGANAIVRLSYGREKPPRE